jgi:hypothetical protein
MRISSSIKAALAALLALSLLVLASAPAQADFGVQPGSFQNNVLDETGNVVALPQAGGHPFADEVAFSLITKPNPHPASGSEDVPDGQPREVKVELPPGLVGSPQSVPQCTVAKFVPPGFGGAPHCPVAAQVGIAEIDVSFVAGGFRQKAMLPLYNLAPPKGTVASFGFVPTVPVVVNLKLRTGGDYGVTASVENTSQAINLYSSVLRVWGVPADHRHDAERYLPGAFAPGDGFGNPLASGLNPEPFLDSPAQCGTPRSTVLNLSSWAEPDSYLRYESPAQEVGGCDRLGFPATAKVSTTSSRAGSPTGLSVDLDLPQSENPNGVITPPLKKAVVTFPQGMGVNAASASGLAGCSPQQISLESPAAADCPAASKVGSVSIKTPLLQNTLDGGVYLATQGTNPFRSLLALYIAVNDPETGVVVKVPGRVSPDPVTGQLTATFDENPQLPFEMLHLQLKSGSTAPLTTPPTCGNYTTHAELTSWARPDEAVGSDSSFTIDEGCDAAGRFAPGFQAGVRNPIAGSFSPFTLRVTREDGEQNVSRIEATLPKGVLAKLAGVPVCADADAAAGNCPVGSQVGTTSVGAGSGPSPLYVPEAGRAPTAVYLAGPYKGAPYSLVVKVPAEAGPFDLGTVTVRNALRVDPVTAQVTASSDPLPQILQGIPITYRDIRVEVDRSDFALNPTSCEPMRVASTITSIQGAVATPSSRFQVGDCADLGFAPKLALRFTGATHRAAHPKLQATVSIPSGGANIKKATVMLPKTELLENAHIRTVCTRAQFNAGAGNGAGCPSGSVYGHAKATTPLLDQPLEGPVYLRANGGERELPDLVASLGGQIHVNLVGYIDSVHSRIRNTFAMVPDAPVSKFVLTMHGGKKGLLANNTELCKAKPVASVKFAGQNGKSHDFNSVVQAGCGKK